MRSRLIVGRLSDDPQVGPRIQILQDNGRYAVERDTLHGATVFYINRSYRTGLPARWEYLDHLDPANIQAVGRIAMELAWTVARQQPRLQAVS